MKVNVVDLGMIKPMIEVVEEEELFDVFVDDEHDEKGWALFIKKLNDGNLDGYRLNKDKIDLTIYFIDDISGEVIRLRNGIYLNVDWRGDVCRVWREESSRTIQMLNKYFNMKV